MGDVVLGELIQERTAAREQMERAIKQRCAIDIYIVIAKEERRADALEQLQQLRERGYTVDYPLVQTKVAKQFQTAEDLGAKVALLYGDEWPHVKMKTLATREEKLIPHETLAGYLRDYFSLSS
jgi:histidyl-tRNA synthetase